MILKSDQDYLRVRGSAISDLILALDGATPTTTLARIHGVGRIDEVLRILGRRGLLARNDQPPGRSPSTADPGVLGRSVVATCPVARWFASALGSVTHPLRADARIVITDSYLRPELVAAPAEGGPWLLVKVGTGSVWVSPVFAEGRAPCWNCVRTRILARDDRLALLLYGGYRQVTLALGLDRLYRAARALLQTGDEATVARWRDIVTESELAFREIYADLRGRAARQLAHRRDRRHPRGIRYCARPGRATVQDPLRRHGQAHGPAGICSILRKAGDAITTVDPALPLHPAERALALALDAFGDTLTEVGWLAWAQRSRLPEFVTLAKTIKKYLALIHNTLDLRRCRSSMPPRRRIRPSVAASRNCATRV